VKKLSENASNKNYEEPKETFGAILAQMKLSSLEILPTLLAIAAAFSAGAVLLLITGYSPIDAYGAMLIGAFGDKFGIGQTLTQATPIIFTGLAFLLASKSGLFNIGIEGQLIVGGFAAAIVGIYFEGLPAFIHVPLALLSGALAGGLWGLIPAILKTKLNAHEVITTMMLSYVASYLTSYLVNYPFKAPGWVAQTTTIAPSAELPRILWPTQLSVAIIIAFLLAIAIHYFLEKTKLGYEIRAVGFSPMVAENNGIDVNRKMILALVISGAIAGMGGAGEIMGVHRRFIDGFSPGYGWDGIAVALVGRLNPIGTIFVAILFGALRSGSMTMTRSVGVPLDIISMLQSLVIICTATPTVFEYFTKRRELK